MLLLLSLVGGDEQKGSLTFETVPKTPHNNDSGLGEAENYNILYFLHTLACVSPVTCLWLPVWMREALCVLHRISRSGKYCHPIGVYMVTSERRVNKRGFEV
jgi:hypothetical protein